MEESNLIALNSASLDEAPAISAPPAPPPDTALLIANTHTVPFRFDGNASEYFRIWIVNILLSIATLGIYSAWAKIRKLRYLYGNTSLDGAAFEYTAEPLKILKGRMIAFALFATYSASQYIYPLLQFAMMGVIFIAIPWLVIKSRMFNLHNTVHRNVRFGFTASYSAAANVFIIGPLLTAVSMGLGYPWYVARKSKFIVDKTSYGATTMELRTTSGQFYPIFFILFLLSFGALIATMVIGGGIVGAVIGLGGEKSGLKILPFVFALLYLLFFLGSRSYLQAALGNLIWNNASLGPHRFESKLRFKALLWLGLTNSLAILFSLGLSIPWATIRSLRYRLENISLIAHGSLDDFAAGEKQKLGAAGEEISDFFDVDIGL
jgi:uncharacterized membrane protein YjgN (DUF898 family)